MDDAWAKAHYRLGCALTAYGEYALAERSFEAARKIAPGDDAVRERLAAVSGAYRSARRRRRDVILISRARFASLCFDLMFTRPGRSLPRGRRTVRF